MRLITRGGSRPALTIICYPLTIIRKPLTIITKRSILGVYYVTLHRYVVPTIP